MYAVPLCTIILTAVYSQTAGNILCARLHNILLNLITYKGFGGATVRYYTPIDYRGYTRIGPCYYAGAPQSVIVWLRFRDRFFQWITEPPIHKPGH